MNTVLQKIVMGVLVAALGLAGLPLAGAYAAAPLATPTPVPGSTAPGNARLERVFARQGRVIQRLGKLYDQYDQGFPRIQKLLDRARARGLDASAVQAALDAFKTALLNNRAAYNQAKALVDAHAGFDAAGQVTDAPTARTTTQSLRAALKQFHTGLAGTGQALRQAIQAFHQAHHNPARTPSAP